MVAIRHKISNVPLFKKMREGQFRGKKSLSPLKMSLEMQGWANVLFKSTQGSCVLLRSFTFFIKECGVLCVLLRSL